MSIAVTQTASMDANIAKKVGVAAALLYNQLVFMSQTDMVKDYDNDGWFYYTAEDFERSTTFTANTFTAAIKRLVDAGMIEKKRTYIKHTTVSVNHFRILYSQEMGIGEVTRDVNSYNIENNIEKNIPIPHKRNCPTSSSATDVASSDASPRGANPHFSSLSGGEPTGEPIGRRPDGGCDSGGALTKGVFDDPVTKATISVKPERGKSEVDRQAWALTGEVTKMCQEAGVRCPEKNIALKSAIVARLKEGAKASDVRTVAKAFIEADNDFLSPKNRSVQSAFSAEFFYQYLNQDNGSKKESIYGRN